MKELQLAIDTSGSVTYVAIRNASGAILELDSGSTGRHEGLAGHVAEAFRQAGADYSEITKGIIGAGPGSFTGLRIGYSFMQGLAMAVGFPVAEAPSLEALAWSLVERGAAIGVLRNAGRDELFTQFFRVQDSAPDPIGEPRIVAVKDLDREIKVATGGGAIALGWPSGEEIPVALDTWRGQLVPVAGAGTGLLSKTGLSGFAGASGLSALRPAYLRAVSARTIAERELTKPRS